MIYNEKKQSKQSFYFYLNFSSIKPLIFLRLSYIINIGLMLSGFRLAVALLDYTSPIS